MRTKRRYQVTSRGAEVLVEAKDVPGLMAMKCFRVKPTPIPEEKAAPADSGIEAVPALVETVTLPFPGSAEAVTSTPPESEQVLPSVPELVPEPEPTWPEPMPEPLPEGVVLGGEPEPREAEAEPAGIDLLDLSTFTVKEIQQMDFDASILDALWAQELRGKNRQGAIGHLLALITKAIRKMEFPLEQLDVLWMQEFQGKNRDEVIKYLEKLMDGALDKK